jgi:cytidylate kinase
MTQKYLESDQHKPRILIAGETAGTGASTTSKILSEHLHIPVISGGKYFRALANRFEKFQIDNPGLDIDTQYKLFLITYQQVFSERGLNGVSELMTHGIKEGAKGDVLATFISAIDRATRNSGKIDSLWDYIVDQKTIESALELPGFVWESKLAVIALELDQMRAIVESAPAMVIPYLSVLLSLDPIVAALRVGQRENRDVNVNEILLRKQRDFERYGDLYHIKGKKVSHNDLSRFADTIINTETASPNEVAKAVIESYIQKLMSISTNRPSIQLLIKKLNLSILALQNSN